MIDTAVLIFWIWHAQFWFRQIKGGASFHTNVIQPVMLQEAGTPGWDFRHDYWIEPSFMFLAGGNPPSAAVSLSIRPRAYVQTRMKLWNPIWFTIHEALSGAVWFGIGLFADAGHKRLAKVMGWFLGARLVFASLIMFAAMARLGVFLEGLFWLVLVCGLLGWGVRSVFQRRFLRGVPLK